MLAKLVIKYLGVGDYYFVVGRREEFNLSGRTELWTLNSEEPVAIGTLSSLAELNSFRRSRND